ncbi:TlpA family protein disulfide reductase [Polynucleobacter sp. MWH-P3-07-1]|uniref:peroxiredoxin family protein n=1 Tax=Polynucleobacter sp. MWH-P3-07-1 TaxID=1743173 RepID=UPI001BFD1281|nr:TlpA disulfide reductase family protein [Polynucleobacter sp. MWH-P3-07-1]QWD83985.1 TlpA family protein disulfide reductase [Polynucleobacter sp. MWH-P3-07-1]
MKRVYQILFILLISALAKNALAAIEVGQPAPNIEGTLIDGKPFSLQANKGKVVLVNFWASWCEPCREEMPAIEAFLKKNKSKGFEVLAITMDKPSDMEQAKQITRNYSFLFAEKKQMDYSDYGRIWRIPSTFIIDKNGILRKNGMKGDATVDTKLLEELVTPLLNAQ